MLLFKQKRKEVIKVMDSEEMEMIKEALRARVGAQIRKWMLRAKMDVAGLAKASGVSADTIYNLLGAKRGANLDSLALLSAALEIPPAVLLMPVE